MLETLIDSGYVAKTARSSYVSTGRTLLLSQGYDVVIVLAKQQRQHLLIS